VTPEARLGTSAGVLADIYDGRLWRHLARDNQFAADPRNIVAGIATDGFQPFKDNPKCSLWPVVLTPYNFPPWLR
jgi:hypothetical protein